MASRDTNHLAPKLKILCEEWLRLCAENGLKVLVYCTWRSNEEQAILYSYGRSKPGKVVTNAKPGQSLHNCVDETGAPAAKAFDFCPLVSGKCVWDRSTSYRRKLWDRAVELAEGIGLRSGRTFTAVVDGERIPNPDWPHLELVEE